MIYVELLILNMLCIYSLNHVFLEMGGRIKDYPLPLPGVPITKFSVTAVMQRGCLLVTLDGSERCLWGGGSVILAMRGLLPSCLVSLSLFLTQPLLRAPLYSRTALSQVPFFILNCLDFAFATVLNLSYLVLQFIQLPKTNVSFQTSCCLRYLLHFY